MSIVFKDYVMDQEEKDEEEGGLGFTVPDTKQLLTDIEAEEISALREEHYEEMKEEEKTEEGKKKAAKRKAQKQGGTICFCGVPYCSIGPFVETT